MSILTEFVKIPLLLEQMVTALNRIGTNTIPSACDCPIGEAPDNAGGDETTIPGQTIGSITFGPAIDANKCDRADYIFNSVLDYLTYLDENNLVALTGGSLSAILGFISGVLILSGPFGALIVGIAGLALSIALVILTTTLDTFDMVSEWTAAQTDLICCMYNGANTDEVRSCIETVLGETSLASGEIDFIMLLLPNAVLSLLFADTDESAIFFDTYEGTFDCAACVEPLANEWMLIPPGTLAYFNSDHAELGVGEVKNDGTEFTLSSVQVMSGAQVLHAVGIVVRGFFETQPTPSLFITVGNDVFGGQITRTVNCPTNPSGGMRLKPDCNTVNQSPIGGCPSSTPFAYPNAQCWFMWRGSPFTMTLRVDTLPTVCP